MNNINRAFLVAERVHARKTYDIYPYMYHIRMTHDIAVRLGYGEAIQIACILHDTTEDGDLSYSQIKKAFGEEVAEIVFAVTDELGRNRKERKAKTYPKIKKLWKAIVVKICDRIANMTHSKLYNEDKFKMYINEYRDFRDQLYVDNEFTTEQKRAWDELETLVINR